MSLLQDMHRAMARYRGWGAEPEAFLAGKGAVLRFDDECEAMAGGYKVKTENRNYREFMGVPVVLSRTASAERVELVMRRYNATATVELIRL